MRPPTIVIAEIGENHLGDMVMARKMIEGAAEAGADIVKFQSYRSEDVASDDPEKDWFAKVQLSDDDHRMLKEAAGRRGVEFLSSPFTVERARFLCEALGLTAIKIASSEMLNIPLLEYVNRHARTVYLSTGLATLEEVEEAVSHLSAVPRRYLLQCTTQYPTRPEDANLNVLRTLAERFSGWRIGYSDHTVGVTAAIAAVALGATVIEKHVTMDKTLPGTDHVLSATPEELRVMIRAIREVEALLGNAAKQPVSGERSIREFVRRRFPKTTLA